MNTGRPLAIDCAGETLWLLPERALWWPARRTLFIADLHLGKAAAFRALGQPVPAGTTRRNLDRLAGLLQRHAPDHLVVLGDFLHAREALTPAVQAALGAWRAGFPRLRGTLVRGNHDRHAGDPPQVLGFSVVDEPWRLGPFAACHHPQAVPGAVVLCGHVHPVARLHGRGRDRLRLPCFVLDGQGLLLPAFGEFTGGWEVAAAPGRVVFVVGEGEGVWRLPAAGAVPPE
jgi:DNA ligase-associated metallophosphoesterase